MGLRLVSFVVFAVRAPRQKGLRVLPDPTVRGHVLFVRKPRVCVFLLRVGVIVFVLFMALYQGSGSTIKGPAVVVEGMDEAGGGVSMYVSLTSADGKLVTPSGSRYTALEMGKK